MRLRLSSDSVAFIGAVVWIVLVYLESLAQHFWLGLTVFTIAYLLTCVALIAHFRSGMRIGIAVRVLCMVPATLFSFALFGILLGVMPLTPFPYTSPIWAQFLGLLFPSLITSVALAAVLLVPASLLFERWSWLIPLFMLLLWILTDSESLRFDEGRTTGDQIALFEQASLLLIVSTSLVKLGPRVRKVVAGAA